MTKFLLVMVTVPDGKTAERISRGLLKAKLAACVNRVPGLKSRYWWKGRIEEAKEELLLIKTTRTRFRSLARWVKGHHPYSVCEVLAVPVAGGNGPYLEWLERSVKP